MYFCSGEPMHFCSGVDKHSFSFAHGRRFTKTPRHLLRDQICSSLVRPFRQMGVTAPRGDVVMTKQFADDRKSKIVSHPGGRERMAKIVLANAYGSIHTGETGVPPDSIPAFFQIVPRLFGITSCDDIFAHAWNVVEHGDRGLG